jgi:hypothetical protein
MTIGREDRRQRLVDPRSGSWSSSSQDFVRLATLLFEQSELYARSIDGNCSPYGLAGIPVLFSAFRALLIEANTGIFGLCRRPGLLPELAAASSELKFFRSYYSVKEPFAVQLEVLWEVRNEMVHPSHMPAGTSHGTPEYLLVLREQGLLQSTNREDVDYNWVSQLQSHRLFTHAFATIESAADVVLSTHHPTKDAHDMHLQSYRQYREINSQVFP